jgi:hypothetical protein
MAFHDVVMMSLHPENCGLNPSPWVPSKVLLVVADVAQVVYVMKQGKFAE